MVTNEEFLTAIFGGAADQAYVVAFAGDPMDDRNRGKWAGNLAHRILRGFQSHENQYWCVSLFHNEYAERRAGTASRRKVLFERMAAVVIDDVTSGTLGDGRKVLASTVLEKVGEPTARVMTSPDNEQWVYVLRPMIEDREVAEYLVNEMIARGLTTDHSDPGMKGVTRLVRLPEGRNGKAKYGSNGFQCRVTAWNPERTFAAEQIAAAWQINLALAIPEPPPLPTDNESPLVSSDVISDEAAALLRAAQGHGAAGMFTMEDVLWRDGNRVIGPDPLLLGLRRLGLVKASKGRSEYEVTCPFVHEHTRQADNGSAYLSGGGINCFHGHCAHRTRTDYMDRVATLILRKGWRDKEAAQLVRMMKRRPPMFQRADATPDQALQKIEDFIAAGGFTLIKKERRRWLCAAAGVCAAIHTKAPALADRCDSMIRARLLRIGGSLAEWQDAMSAARAGISEEV